MKKIFFVFVISVMILNAQSFSVHQFQKEYYTNLKSEESIVQNFQTKISGVKKLNKVVFGYLPDWEYSTGAGNYLRYDLITHLAVFSFQADASGNLKDPAGWPWNDVINSASANNVKLIASVTNFNGDEIHKIFTDVSVRNSFFNNIKTKFQIGGFSGVNIDFENVLDADKSTVIVNFFSELKKFFSNINTPCEISFASPVVNFSGWNFNGISQSCDYLFVMCYDFYGSWSTTTGPSAPLEGGYFNIKKSFANYYSSVSSQKLILGVPYYGNYWKTKTGDAYTIVDTTKSKKEFVKSLRYKEIFPSYQSKEILWDALSKTRWLRWQDATWNQIWYDDSSSIAIKYDYAIQNKLLGVGIWALGYDNGSQDFWKLIERKFTGTVDVESEMLKLPSSFELYQNYPNPFNPSTVINYKILKAGRVALRIFDLFGREIKTLVDKFQQPGVYHIEFNVENISNTNWNNSSGVYFYSLFTEQSVQTKKMLLIK